MEGIDSDNSEIVAEIDLFIIKIVCFGNNLVHATFSDNTSIVVHPSFEYFTYFHSDNTKSDMKSEFLIRQYSIDSKINLLVSVFNLFAGDICPFTAKYVRENGLNCDIVKLLSPLCFVYWIDEDKQYETNDLEYYMISSQDSHTKLFLFKNMRVIKVEYLTEYDIVKNEYIKVCKFYTINNISPNWVTPLILLMNHYGINISTSNPLLINWNIANERIVNNEYRTELPKINTQMISDNDDNHLCDIDHIIINPLAFIYHKTQSVKFIYTRNFTYIVNKKDTEIDIINNEFPYMNIYTTGKCDILVFIEDNNKTEDGKHIHIDTYSKIAKENKEGKLNDESVMDDIYGEISIEIENIKKYGNIYRSNHINYTTNMLLYPYEIKKKDIDFVFQGNELFLFREIKGIGEFFSYKSGSVKGNFFDRTVVRMNSDMQYVDILNSRGEKIILKTSEISGDNVYYKYVKLLIDFSDACFGGERLKREEEKTKYLQNYIKHKLSQIEDTEKIIFKKNKMFSDEYIYHKQPTKNDIEILLQKNEKILKDIKSIKAMKQNFN